MSLLAISRFAFTRAVDRVGALASLACAIHCAAMPILLAALPIVGTVEHDGHSGEWFHVVVIPLSLALALVSAGVALRAGRRGMAAAFVGAAGLLAVSQALHAPPLWLAPLAGLLLAGAHLANVRLARSARAVVDGSLDPFVARCAPCSCGAAHPHSHAHTTARAPVNRLAPLLARPVRLDADLAVATASGQSARTVRQ